MHRASQQPYHWQEHLLMRIRSNPQLRLSYSFLHRTLKFDTTLKTHVKRRFGCVVRVRTVG